MAEYTFKCEQCEKVFTLECRMSEIDEVKQGVEAAPCPCGDCEGVVKKQLSIPTLMDPIRLGRFAPDNNFQSRLKQIRQKHGMKGGSFGHNITEI